MSNQLNQASNQVNLQWFYINFTSTLLIKVFHQAKIESSSHWYLFAQTEGTCIDEQVLFISQIEELFEFFFEPSVRWTRAVWWLTSHQASLLWVYSIEKRFFKNLNFYYKFHFWLRKPTQSISQRRGIKKKPKKCLFMEVSKIETFFFEKRN
jgi:hypothetical protein